MDTDCPHAGEASTQQLERNVTTSRKWTCPSLILVHKTSELVDTSAMALIILRNVLVLKQYSYAFPSPYSVRLRL